MKYGISRIALIAALAAGGAAQAQDAADGDDVIVLDALTLSASLAPVPVSRTGATVDVVTAEDLQKAGDMSLASQLARLPGVSMSRNGGMGTQTALRLRGLGGQYIGVRIDGIDVADASGTVCAYDFGSTTSGGISRIEVLRGSQSALFGSNAIGGVVDITTFRPTTDGLSAEAGIEAGSNGSYSGTVSAGVKGERGELAFSLSRSITDGISAWAAGTEDDGFQATFLTFHGAYDLTDSLRIGLNGFWRDSFTEFDDSGSDALNTEDGKLRGARVWLQADTGPVSHEFSYSRTETGRFYTYPAWSSTSTFDGDRDQFAYSGGWEPTTALTLGWGLDRTEESYVSDFDSGDASTTSVYAEAIWAATPDLDLSFALRRDEHKDFGGKATGRAALAWRPTEDWIIRAVGSTGFSAPSLYQLYSPYGDAGLQPETSRSVELGVERLLPGGSIQLTLFDTTVRDKIDYVPGPGACSSSWGCYAQIPGDTRTRGVEISGKYAIGQNWEIFGNYTYADAKSRNAGAETRLARVPRHDLTLGVEGALTDRISVLGSLQHVADFLDGGTSMPDYTLVNLGLNWQVSDTAQVYLRVENLFDETYQTARGYGQPGRQVFVGARTSF